MKTKESEIKRIPMSEIHEKQRANSLQVLKDLGIKVGFFTCDSCKDVTKCEYAFDPYNTDGSCLWTK